MSEIYAIIKDSDTSKIRMIVEYIPVTRLISDLELCKRHNYATDLYSAYCSCLPSINVGELQNSISARIDAVEMEETIKGLKHKYKDSLIAYSHRYGGWTAFSWNFNDDIKFVVETNFGFGSCSYFRISIFYKGLKLAPYSSLVKYRYANFTSITSHTYTYNLAYSEWNNLMVDALDFYNAVVENRDNQIFRWLSTHLEKMTSELEKYIDSTYCYFDNYTKETYNSWISYRKTTEVVDGDVFWVTKSFKITEAIRFIDNIKSLPNQVSPSKYIDRIYSINRTFLPKLTDKIDSLEIDIQRTEEQISTINIETSGPIHTKLSIHMALKTPVNEIRSSLKLDKKTIEWVELNYKLSSLKPVLKALSEDRDKIIAFLKSEENETTKDKD